MVIKQGTFYFLCTMLMFFSAGVFAADEQSGGIRGMVYDKDFNVPLPAGTVSIAETGQQVTVSDEGNYVFKEVAPGTYTLVFSKESYTRQVKANVIVSPGQMTELDVSLSGDFVEMEEFVVQEIKIGAGTETELLKLRLESPALMGSVSSELMSQAGASDAASALRLVAGTTVQDGKYAVVRGLPDRYVNSQMNGVRLPTADADKRAVQLDQYPAAVIESIQVSKTFTPDQQGDASGGAVNVVLKTIPDSTKVGFSSQVGFNTQVRDKKYNFPTYQGGGVDFWGKDDGSRDPQTPGQNWKGAVGPSEGQAPTDYKWSVSGGGKKRLNDLFTLGSFGSFFYEQKGSYYDGGIDDQYWLEQGSKTMVPQYSQGAPAGPDEPFKTSLFDMTRSSQKVQWGGLGMLGLDIEDHSSLSLLYMYTRDAEDKVTLAENTRGKASLHTYWPSTYGPEFDNYNPYDMTHAANQSEYRGASPYRRNETLEYTERTTQTLQLHGKHTLPDLDITIDKFISFQKPEVDWTISQSDATLYQPDKRLFTTTWGPTSSVSGVHGQHKSAQNFTLGNLQRIWKDISEDSEQYSANVKFPFEQWSGDEGYMKFGVFDDKVDRSYNQDSYSNFNDNSFYRAPWDKKWSSVFPSQNHLITAADIDVDYTGKQEISAGYYMADMPLCSFFNVIGGARYEKTELSIVNIPEKDVVWYPGGGGAVQLQPGAADVDFSQRDVLPSIGLQFKPIDPVTMRACYTETVARQTFKELTPIQQQEYVGGDMFIGNPDLQMSALKNYDLRLDWTPYENSLVSASWFNKDVTDPIEYAQRRGADFTYTTAVNYPEGQLKGYELELRQQLDHLWDKLTGLTVGANATFITSDVTLPDNEAQDFANVGFPITNRDMTNAPNHLYNFFMIYDLAPTGTQVGLFYTIRGDTLVAGAGDNGQQFIPDVYETEYGTLNFSLSQKLGEIWKLKFQAKNLLDPAIKTVYRSDYIGEDVTKTYYTKGMDFSISLSADF